MIVNLSDSGFVHLRLTISLESGYEDIRQSWESVGLSEGHRFRDDFHYLELAGFRRGGKQYRVEARLSAVVDDNSRLTLAYGLGEVQRQRTRRANLTKIGLFLDNLAVPCSVVCFAGGDFTTDQYTPILGLPLLRFNMPHEFFDELRGIRLAKIDDGTESDSVALDMHEEGELHVSVQTTYSTTTSSDIPSEALTKLTELMSHAVTEAQLNVGDRT